MNRRRFLQILGALPLFGLVPKITESKEDIEIPKPKELVDSIAVNFGPEDTISYWKNAGDGWHNYATVRANNVITLYIDGEKCT
jgi:hypothetical protein